jgi:signal transduction histidine kinase
MSRRDTAVDVALAGGLIALGLALALSLDLTRGEEAVAALLVLVHVGPLTVRRRWPVGVLAAMVATAVLAPVVGVPVVVLGPAALVAVYTAGSMFAPPRSTLLLVAASGGMAIAVVFSGMDAGTVVTNVLAFAVAWWLGDRSRRALAAAEAERSAADALVAQAVAEERLRIARELHDVVAHAMSVIAVQAGSGRLVIDQSPDVARQALSTIETTSRDALREMRRLLTVLRDDDDVQSTLAPSPGVSDLAALVATAGDAGLDVRLITEGPSVELPAGTELCAYRIVQEALTNVRKHAHASAADVTVRFAPTALELEVVDDGVGCDPAGPPTVGHGLLGLRERAELYGGTLEAGPTPGGFRVRARIPVAEPT